MKIYILMLFGLLFLGNVSSGNAKLTLAEPPSPCLAQSINNIKPRPMAGSASLNKLFFHVYDAIFWSGGNRWKMNEPHALQLKYFVGIDSEDFVERTLEELKLNPDVSADMLKEFAKILPQLMPDVENGDNIIAGYVPETGLQFCHNNNIKGVIKDAKMAEAFLAIWLGEHTSEPEMRKKLLRL